MYSKKMLPPVLHLCTNVDFPSEKLYLIRDDDLLVEDIHDL